MTISIYSKATKENEKKKKMLELHRGWWYMGLWNSRRDKSMWLYWNLNHVFNIETFSSVRRLQPSQTNTLDRVHFYHSSLWVDNFLFYFIFFIFLFFFLLPIFFFLSHIWSLFTLYIYIYHHCIPSLASIVYPSWEMCRTINLQ